MELFAIILKPVVASDTGRESKADLAVDRLATKFAKKVPELEFSPAQVMSFLLQHRQSPMVAVEHAESWVSTMLREKKDKLNRAIGDMYPANTYSQSTSMGGISSAAGRSSSDEHESDDAESLEGFLKIPPSSPAQRSGRRRAISLHSQWADKTSLQT